MRDTEQEYIQLDQFTDLLKQYESYALNNIDDVFNLDLLKQDFIRKYDVDPKVVDSIIKGYLTWFRNDEDVKVIEEINRVIESDWHLTDINPFKCISELIEQKPIHYFSQKFHKNLSKQIKSSKSKAGIYDTIIFFDKEFKLGLRFLTDDEIEEFMAKELNVAKQEKDKIVEETKSTYRRMIKRKAIEPELEILLFSFNCLLYNTLCQLINYYYENKRVDSPVYQSMREREPNIEIDIELIFKALSELGLFYFLKFYVGNDYELFFNHYVNVFQKAKIEKENINYQRKIDKQIDSWVDDFNLTDFKRTDRKGKKYQFKGTQKEFAVRLYLISQNGGGKFSALCREAAENWKNKDGQAFVFEKLQSSLTSAKDDYIDDEEMYNKVLGEF